MDCNHYSGIVFFGFCYFSCISEITNHSEVNSDFDSRADYAKYYIYSDADMIAPAVKEQGDFEEGMEITLQDGDFLKLEECVIK